MTNDTVKLNILCREFCQKAIPLVKKHYKEIYKNRTNVTFLKKEEPFVNQEDKEVSNSAYLASFMHIISQHYLLLSEIEDNRMRCTIHFYSILNVLKEAITMATNEDARKRLVDFASKALLETLGEK